MYGYSGDKVGEMIPVSTYLLVENLYIRGTASLIPVEKKTFALVKCF
jgi:hypothetical protein